MDVQNGRVISEQEGVAQSTGGSQSHPSQQYNKEEATPETMQNIQDVPINERTPSIILEMPSERQKQQRANILSKLRNEPASTNLQAYFERLNKGSPAWDIETFIEGANTFAKLCGPERSAYYDNQLKGLRSANSFTRLWNQTYPEDFEAGKRAELGPLYLSFQ